MLVDREAYIRVADADGEGARTAITGPWGSAGQPVWQPLAEIASLDVRPRASRRRVLRRGLRATVHCAQTCQIVASLHDRAGAVARVVDAAPTTGSRTLRLRPRRAAGRRLRLVAEVADVAGNHATLRQRIALRGGVSRAD